LAAIQTLAQGWPDQHTRILLERAIFDLDDSVREAAAQALAQRKPDQQVSR
jgi:hypothetical protein